MEPGGLNLILINGAAGHFLGSGESEGPIFTYNLNVLQDLNRSSPSLSLPPFSSPYCLPTPPLLAFPHPHPAPPHLLVCSKPVPFPLPRVESLESLRTVSASDFRTQHPAVQQQQQPLHTRLLGPHPQRRAVREGNSAEGLPLPRPCWPSVPERMRPEHHTSAFKGPGFSQLFLYPISFSLFIICHYYCSFVHLNLVDFMTVSIFMWRN